MILETERLLLRPREERDAADIFEYARDPRVGPAAGWWPHKSMEETLEFIRGYQNPRDCAIVEKATGKVIGTGGLVEGHKDWLPGADDEIGYVLNPAYWGRGLIPEAMAEVIRYAFAELDLDHIWCGYFDGNERSRRVGEKLGFVPYRSVWLQVPQLKERRLEHYTLLTRKDWEAQRR